MSTASGHEAGPGFRRVPVSCCINGSWLVHDHQAGAERGLQLAEDVSQLRFGVGQLLPRVLHRYLRRRNANARHLDVLAAQRRERARIHSEMGIRWGGRARCPAV